MPSVGHHPVSAVNELGVVVSHQRAGDNRSVLTLVGGDVPGGEGELPARETSRCSTLVPGLRLGECRATPVFAGQHPAVAVAPRGQPGAAPPGGRGGLERGAPSERPAC